MSTESEGRAWYDKIYRKLETILVEVDSLASECKVSSESSDPPELDSVINEPDVKQHEQIEGDTSKEKLTDSVLIDEKMLSSSSLPEEHNDCNQIVARSLCQQKPISSRESQPHYGIPTDDSSLVTFATDSQEKFNQDEFFIEDFDVDSLDTINLYDMTFREDPSDFDDKLLYVARDRTL